MIRKRNEDARRGLRLGTGIVCAWEQRGSGVPHGPTGGKVGPQLFPTDKGQQRGSFEQDQVFTGRVWADQTRAEKLAITSVRTEVSTIGSATTFKHFLGAREEGDPDIRRALPRFRLHGSNVAHVSI